MILWGLLVFSTSLVYAGVEGEMQVLPESLDFGEVEAYSTTVVTKQITISNCGTPDSILCWGVTANDCWLTVEDDTGGMIDLPNGDNRYVQVSLGACGLCVDEVDIYKGTFTVLQYAHDDSGTDIVCTTNEIDRVNILATMNIPEFNVLEVDPDELDFGTVSEELTFDVINAGEGEMEWEAVVSEDNAWLTIEGGSCTSGTVCTGLSDTVTLEVDRSKVEGCADEFNASVKVTSTNATPEEAIVNIIMERVIEPPHPTSPTPVDGATDQSLYSTLKWLEGESQGDVGGIVYFDVYFSTNQTSVESDSPSVLVCEDLETPYCDPSEGGGQLDENTTYYWKVSATDECQDNTVTSDLWSFTTGSAEEPACPVTLLLPLNDSEVTLLRRFRDEVLAKSFDGERYVDLYYSPHAIEALLILLFNPELRMCADMIVTKSLPAIQSLLRVETALIDSETRADIELFLEEFEKDASPDLKRAIGIIKKDIAAGDVFKGFGFSVRQ